MVKLLLMNLVLIEPFNICRMTKENYVKLLEHLITEHYCVPRTIKGFWHILSNYKENESKEYKSIFGEKNVNVVEIDNRTISLAVRGSFSDNYIYLAVAYHIYLKKENKKEKIGSYKMVFSLDGGVMDDILYFD